MKVYMLISWVRWKKLWIGIILIAIGLLSWRWIGEMKKMIPLKAKVISISIPKPMTEKKWRLCWLTPPEIRGMSSEMRNGNFPVTITLCDTFQFKIVNRHNDLEKTEAFIMNWDKAAEPNYGSWSQKDPPLKGTWFLKQVNPVLFFGWWQTEGETNQVPMWLEAVN